MSPYRQSEAPIAFGPDGLVPVVIQDADSDAVLMLAFMNAEALQRTRETGRTHFWSRSRNKLWRKGETSGHEQLVDEIFVNCEQNSLLITVRQIGAVCHTGYPTCFYRRIEDDDTLTVIRERWFDPADVYDQPGNSLADRSRRWFGAYEYLRDHDLTGVSGTSKRLRQHDSNIERRVADELRELAGVLIGEHRHAGLEPDVVLEGSQGLYWIALYAVRENVGWDELRPDRALVTADESLSLESAARLLLAEAESWHAPGRTSTPPAARAHAAMALIAQACRSAGIESIALIDHDLEELQMRPYLESYFGPSS